MATSRGTSNGPDVQDLMEALMDFQDDFRLPLTIHISLGGSPGRPDLLLELMSPLELDEQSEVKPSVYQKSRWRYLNVRSLESAILLLLHKADFEMVKWEEERKASSSEAAPGAF